MASGQIVEDKLHDGRVIRYRRMDSGTCYGMETPREVIEILETARRSEFPIRLFYGDRESGRDWLEENDVVGYIGKSTGRIQIPLMIKNRRKSGGPGLLDTCIVKIMRGRQVLYEHPTYNIGHLEIRPSEMEGYESEVLHDGSVHARFKTVRKAEQFLAFLTGTDRNAVDNRVDAEDKADGASEAIQRYSEAVKSESGVGKSNISSLVAGVMHLCERTGTDFGAALKAAGSEFQRTPA